MLRLFATNNEWTGLLARLVIAIVLFPHGAQKLLGWWSGHGFTATMEYFTQNVRLPYFIGVLVILVEFFCPLLIIAGLGTRIAAFAIFVVMAGIILTVQNKYFFMNWFGNQNGEGMEFFLLMIGLSLVCMIEGGGKLSADRLIETYAIQR
jgi:putative oxidoreductase